MAGGAHLRAWRFRGAGAMAIPLCRARPLAAESSGVGPGRRGLRTGNARRAAMPARHRPYQPPGGGSESTARGSEFVLRRDARIAGTGIGARDGRASHPALAPGAPDAGCLRARRRGGAYRSSLFYPGVPRRASQNGYRASVRSHPVPRISTRPTLGRRHPRRMPKLDRRIQ